MRESGNLSVISDGEMKRQKLSVDNWDTQINQIVSLYNSVAAHSESQRERDPADNCLSLE